jgi:disulfide bond formation protein DsbB
LGDKYKIHVRFRAATGVVDAASNPPPLQFVPEISKLPRMLQQPVDCDNRRPLWCLFGLLLHFVSSSAFFCSFLYCSVEISSSVLESTAACASPIKNLEIGHQAGLSGDDNNNHNYNA